MEFAREVHKQWCNSLRHSDDKVSYRTGSVVMSGRCAASFNFQNFIPVSEYQAPHFFNDALLSLFPVPVRRPPAISTVHANWRVGASCRRDTLPINMTNLRCVVCRQAFRKDGHNIC